ncbi:hypothetical protein [Leifsonia poae]|uniref:hypothetical protein n=1 Tax=Leifsonia poae TaxID=110933 RepID=UPI001CBB47A7|nr:hypothetical protein [Leifsonia poae]
MPPPASWKYQFEEFTGEGSAGEWALAAAIVIADVRARTSHGPTFGELFLQLLPDTNGLPGQFPDGMEYIERRRAVSGFRLHTAIEWHRQGMVRWSTGVERSLQVGRRFHMLSHTHQRTVFCELSDALGPTLVSALLGAESVRRQHNSASHGGVRLTPVEWKRLKFAYAMWNLLEASEGPDVARRWFVGGNARLGQSTPVMAIRNDRHVQVRSAIESFIQDAVDE